MIKEVNPDFVLIEPEEITDKTEGGIIKADTVKATEMKKQNRGKVLLVGKDCTWAEKDDFVSFYRNAATEIPDEGKALLIVHEDHILCKIVTSV